MNPQYTSLAAYYDRLNSHIDYFGYAAFLASRFREYGVPDGSLVLDLACGTGNITLPLSEMGYDMIAVDSSCEMLDVGRRKPGGDRILWLCQDMRSFELYGTVAAVVSCLDSVNYLTGRRGLERCFSLVRNYLDPDGVFIFDVNSPHKFRTFYGENQYVMEAPGVYCGWKNHYDPRTGLCDFELSLFAEESPGIYRRYDELQRERCWSEKILSSVLSAAGFEIVAVYGDTGMNPPDENSDRLFFIARAVKGK